MNMKRLFIIRGLSGSGKSTLGKILAGDNSFAADEFFTNKDGEYNFQKTKLKEAHAYCWGKVESAMIRGEEPIAVCNTFSKLWEAKAYFIMADTHNYEVFVIECENSFGGTHGVPQETVDRMERNWDKFRGAGRKEISIPEEPKGLSLRTT